MSYIILRSLWSANKNFTCLVLFYNICSVSIHIRTVLLLYMSSASLLQYWHTFLFFLALCFLTARVDFVVFKFFGHKWHGWQLYERLQNLFFDIQKWWQMWYNYFSFKFYWIFWEIDRIVHNELYEFNIPHIQLHCALRNSSSKANANISHIDNDEGNNKCCSLLFLILFYVQYRNISGTSRPIKLVIYQIKSFVAS